MKVALLSPIAWRTPPRHYGPWENIVWLLADGLVDAGIDVTLFATGDSLSSAKLESVCPRPYEEDRELDPKVWECLHIANLFEKASQFDLIHNHFDFLPLSYSRLVKTPVITTIHGFSSPRILPVYKAYNGHVHYVSISNADRCEDLNYCATIYHGIKMEEFQFQPQPGKYLLFFGRIHPDKGTREAIEIAAQADLPLLMAGIIQDEAYYYQQIAPLVDGNKVVYLGPVGPQKRNDLLGGALALLHPIFFAEPFGLSVVEAMACGTPVIAFNKGSMPEVIREGVSGFLVDTVEEAVQALDKIETLSRNNCRRWVEERFSQKRMVDDYIAVYNKILTQNQTGQD
ncbi:MAG: glycosyltransferase family 4 protein [Syntrophomonadaceae bacterium]|nr:glycosyltransferase family 4 protein [Syntrophomonadaceae bacterium]